MSQRLSIVLISFALAVTLSIAFATTLVYAQANITYPIAELGNCASKEPCRAYCDDLSHADECASFAEAHGLMSAEEAQAMRAFGGPGPGGCTSAESCHNYCENVAHINECLAYAEQHNVMSSEELREARMVARALAEGAKLPGGCTSKSSCEAYCEDMSHMNECIAFAEKAGFMSTEELTEAKKMVSFIEAGGKMPGNCRGEAACKAYCEVEEHMTECAEFALRAGFMSPEEAAMFKKTGGKGPGGCVGRACETYCQDEAHREECIAFAMEHDLMSAEDKQRMNEGMQKTQEMFKNMPPEVKVCIEKTIGSEEFARIERGEGFAGPKLGEVMPQCFTQVMGGEQHAGPFGQGIPPVALDCMRKIFGEDVEAQMRAGKIDPGAHDQEIRSCVEAQMGAGYLNDQGEWERPQTGEEYRHGPPEGHYMPPGGYPMPPEGMMPPAGHMPPEGDMMPPHEGFMPSPEMMPPQEGGGEPVSSRNSLIANVFFVVTSLLGFH